MLKNGENNEKWSGTLIVPLCHCRYGDLHTEAEGVYKDLLVAQFGVLVPAVTQFLKGFF
jgi:hypothetical protein